MKAVRIALFLAAAGLFSACSYSPFKEFGKIAQNETVRRNSDYLATGNLEEARAYAYGSATLLEFGNTTPMSLSIEDESGKEIEYEKIGRYYRIAEALDVFSVSANGQTVMFTLPMISRTFSARGAKRASTEPAREIIFSAAEPVDTDTRRLTDEASKEPKDTKQGKTDSAAVVRVSFSNRGTNFKPTPEVAKTLIASAETADRIEIRGRTDSRKAGRADPGIALRRALSAKRFLIDHGINPQKIAVFSQGEGNFIADNTTKEGRALNRRVEIEFFNTRLSNSQGQQATIVQVGRRLFRVSPDAPVCEVSVTCP